MGEGYSGLSMEEHHIHLIVEEGADKGLEITVPPDGLRVGRSSSNDVVLKDPAMSRFHCRFFFKSSDGLWAEDLGSANQTMINGAPLQEARVRVGERIMIGDTVIKIVSDQPPEQSNQKLFESSSSADSHGKIEVLRSRSEKVETKDRLLRSMLMVVVAVLVLGSATIWVIKIFRHPYEQEALVTEEQSLPLEISYEKVQASPDNIFRYEMKLKDNKLSIQIDDLQNQRHVPKTQNKKVDSELIQSLVESINDSGFFEMKEEYKGLPSDVWDVWDLSITVGRKTHRVKVWNCMEPDSFKGVREVIEEFGQNELGLAALALSHEKLLELAQDAWLVGHNLYDQREVKNENLARAIRSLKEVDWYLETIEPKPGYFVEAVALRAECERDLNAIYNNHNFLANRAIKLKDWEEAAGQLRLICERIPDRSDDRHQSARKKLIDVERRLKKK